MIKKLLNDMLFLLVVAMMLLLIVLTGMIVGDEIRSLTNNKNNEDIYRSFK